MTCNRFSPGDLIEVKLDPERSFNVYRHTNSMRAVRDIDSVLDLCADYEIPMLCKVIQVTVHNYKVTLEIVEIVERAQYKIRGGLKPDIVVGVRLYTELDSFSFERPL